MKVSVLVDNYNYEEYLCDAVRSALEQTRPPDEIIVVDDGSTDGSVDKLRAEFGGRRQVRIFAKENGGQLSAFNAAFVQSSGELICFLDSDDVWEPNYLERVLDFYARHPECDFLHTGLRKFGAVEAVELAFDHDRDYGFSVLETIMRCHWRGGPTSSLSIRREILDRLLPLDLERDWRMRADDCLVWGAAIAGAHKFFLAEPLVRYRIHGRNAWHGRVYSAHEIQKREYTLNRLTAHVTARCGYDVAGLFDHAVSEFRSAGSGRSLDEYFVYRGILGRSGRSPGWRMRERWRLFKAFVRLRLRMLARGPALASDARDGRAAD